MERHARVASLWSWLPGFRAVAETESVHEAARKLDVSPSSLSRTIALLEDALGRPLFERGGGVLRLTPLGRELLDRVRDAMRAIDDVTAPEPDRVRIAAPRDLVAALVLPALARLTSAGVPVAARIAGDPDVDPAGRLLRGELDVVVSRARLDERHLESTRIGAIAVGLYVGAANERADPPHVVYRSADGPIGMWPDHVPRVVALEVDDAHAAAIAAAQAGFIVALPDRLAERLGQPLRRAAAAPFEPVELFAARRRSLGPRHAADAIVAALVDVST
jgi:DNA-binding transcriptional LysR family regulator